jgi:uncharacterized repeat protein (TIGR03803 family)
MLAGCGESQPPIGASIATNPSSSNTSDAVSNGRGYKTLYSFQGAPNAMLPHAGLTVVNGVFYGTSDGGSCYAGTCGGTVYEMTPSGTEHVIYDFKGGTDGFGPSNLLNLNGKLYGVLVGGGKCDSSAYGCGTVFKLSTQGDEHVLYRFKGGRDGDRPDAGLTLLNGMLYGTTYYGGKGMGTVFEISTTGHERVLHRFSGGSDGWGPSAQLIVFKGKLYGTTSYGGSNQCQGTGCGTVFSVSASGAEHVLYAFQGAYSTGDGASPEAGLVAVNNVLYGTTGGGGYTRGHCGGGTGGCGTVFSITPAGKERVFYRFKDRPDGEGPSASLVAANGKLFGTTYKGGLGPKYYSGYGTVFEVTPSGTESVIHRFRGAPDGNGPFSNLVYFKGILYGTTDSGGSGCSNFSPPGCGTVFKLSP